MRPPEYATDTCRIEVAVRHALDKIEAIEGCYDAVMVLQNSSPLRTSVDINKCIEYMQILEYDAIISVTDVHEHPYKVKIIENSRLRSWMPEMDSEFYRRQDLPPMYIDNGAIYLINRDLFVEHGKLMVGNCGAYMMPRERSIDVHTIYDAVMVDALIRARIT
jgi:CMP-N,N'-diacetyllegionaminic acid synthase